MQGERSMKIKKSWIFILAIILLLLIPSMRFLYNKPLLPGDTPYYHTRMANYIKENGISTQDPLIQRPYIIQPRHLILAFTGNIYLASVLIPLLCGLLSLVLFFLILKQLKIDIQNILIILLVLILSPLFIFIFSTSNQYAAIILLILLGFYLFIRQDGKIVQFDFV